MDIERDVFPNSVAFHAFRPRRERVQVLDVVHAVIVLAPARQGRAGRRSVIVVLEKIAVPNYDILSPKLRWTLGLGWFALRRFRFFVSEIISVVRRMNHDLHVIRQGRFQVLKFPDRLGLADFLETILRFSDRGFFGPREKIVDGYFAFADRSFPSRRRRKGITKIERGRM